MAEMQVYNGDKIIAHYKGVDIEDVGLVCTYPGGLFTHMQQYMEQKSQAYNKALFCGAHIIRKQPCRCLRIFSHAHAVHRCCHNLCRIIVMQS